MNHVLIVDDLEDARELLTELVNAGFPQAVVTVADSVAAARTAIAGRRFDLALVDLSLGDGFGTEVIALLRQRQGLKHGWCGVHGVGLAEQGGVAACCLGGVAQVFVRLCGRPEPTQSTMPFNVRRIGQIQNRRGLRQAQTPQTKFRRRRFEKRQALFTTRLPIGCSRVLVHARGGAAQGLHLGDHARASRLDGRHRAPQAHKQQVLRGCGGGVVHPSTGVQRQGLPAPAVQQF